jgi:hypothetical protein
VIAIAQKYISLPFSAKTKNLIKNKNHGARMSWYTQAETARRKEVMDRVCDELEQWKNDDSYPQKLKDVYLEGKHKLLQADAIFSHIDDIELLNGYAQMLKESLAYLRIDMIFMEGTFLPHPDPRDNILVAAFISAVEMTGHAEVLYERARMIEEHSQKLSQSADSGLEKKIAS